MLPAKSVELSVLEEVRRPSRIVRSEQKIDGVEILDVLLLQRLVLGEQVVIIYEVNQLVGPLQHIGKLIGEYKLEKDFMLWFCQTS